MTRTTYDFGDGHECDPVWCREWVLEGEIITWHEAKHDSNEEPFVTIQALSLGAAVERYPANTDMTRMYLIARGIDFT